MFSDRTNGRITSFDFTEEDVSLRTKIFYSAKTHGCDNISVRMIKISTESLTVPLKIIFEQSLKEGRFLEIWKKANVALVYKKKQKSFKKLSSN